MAYDALAIKDKVVAAIVAETDNGDALDDFNVYDRDDMPYRTFFPCVIVNPPTNTLIERYVGGPRGFQLQFNIEMYVTEKHSKTVAGPITYTRNDLIQVYAEDLENILESIDYSSTATILGIPTTRSMTTEGTDGDHVIYAAQIVYIVSYMESD